MKIDPSEMLEPSLADQYRDTLEQDSDANEALDAAARGMSGTSDETPDGTGEIDAIGEAAGLVVRDDRPFRGIDEVDRRDDRRWELDPASAIGDPANA